MPYCPIEKSLYCQVKYFFKKYSEYEEVKRLKVIYASGDCCPLYERDPENYIKKVQPYDRIIQSLDYIVMAFELYREFPAKNTIPMKLVRYLLENNIEDDAYIIYYFDKLTRGETGQDYIVR